MKILVDKNLLERVTEQLEHYMGDFRSDACIALRAILAQPAKQQEPVVDFKRKFECLVDHCKRQDREIAELRYDQNIRRFYDDGAVWFWAGDETDNIETLACPVVINAGDLRALIKPPAPADTRLVEALEESIIAMRSVISQEAKLKAVAKRVLGDAADKAEEALAAHKGESI